jgi:type IV pilus assembly protein PilQ
MTRWFKTVVVLSCLMLFPALLSAQETARAPSVTLNLTDVDIHQFLRMAHDIGGMNIVVAPDVRGRVTVFLRDVRWDQALDAVLEGNGLIGLREGNVLRVMTVEDARREAQQRRELERTKLALTPLEVCSYRLEYSDARAVAGMLQAFLSPRGRVLADVRTNSVIIAEVPQALKNLGITPMLPSRGWCTEAARIADQ